MMSDTLQDAAKKSNIKAKFNLSSNDVIIFYLLILAAGSLFIIFKGIEIGYLKW